MSPTAAVEISNAGFVEVDVTMHTRPFMRKRTQKNTVMMVTRGLSSRLGDLCRDRARYTETEIAEEEVTRLISADLLCPSPSWAGGSECGS